MVQREIYFVRHGMLFKKTLEVTWDNECMTLNKEFTSGEIFEHAESWMQPCVDVSTANRIKMFKPLSIYQVKDGSDNPVSELWKVLDSSKEVDLLPPGSYDLVYLSNLSERQIGIALPIGSFYDTMYNSSRKKTSPAISLCALQMLYAQNKLEYLADMHKFLHWYFINCRFPLEYNEHYK